MIVGCSSATPTPTVAPTSLGPTQMPALLRPCLISVPEQVGPTIEAVEIRFLNTAAADCATYLANQNTGATGWHADHPATLTNKQPLGVPTCFVTLNGVRAEVFGGDATKQICY
jgi:hypothetical protein